MSNMKREFEDDPERDYRQAGLTNETIARISAWIENLSKESNDKDK